MNMLLNIRKNSREVLKDDEGELWCMVKMIIEYQKEIETKSRNNTG